MPTSFDAEKIHAAPKVLLHDHLDGGLRPATVLDLAAKVGHKLPADTEEALGRWFAEAANSGNLVTYLETFAHTVAVMQTVEALHRVAYECAIDLADDGVVYAEVRYAPELFVEKGLSLPEVIEAVNSGFVDGMADASEQGAKIVIRSLLCGMRQTGRVAEIAELAVKYRDQGVAGFDIAGPEDGFPPTDHQKAFDSLREQNAHFTIHAGEAAGLESIWQALQCCHAERLGHGVRIIDEVTLAGKPVMDDLDLAGANLGSIELGTLAAYVRDTRVPLEMCPHSNVQTGAAPSIAKHPISLLKKLGFTVTINTDNRLMSETSMGKEFTELVAQAGWSGADLRDATINAMEGAFAPLPQREAIIAEVIRPGYAALGVE